MADGEVESFEGARVRQKITALVVTQSWLCNVGSVAIQRRLDHSQTRQDRDVLTA